MARHRCMTLLLGFRSVRPADRATATARQTQESSSPGQKAKVWPGQSSIGTRGCSPTPSRDKAALQSGAEVWILIDAVVRRCIASYQRLSAPINNAGEGPNGLFPFAGPSIPLPLDCRWRWIGPISTRRLRRRRRMRSHALVPDHTGRREI